MLVLFFVMMTVLVLMSVLIILVMVMMFIVVGVFMLVLMRLVFVSMMVVFVRMRVSVGRAIRMGVLVAVLLRKVNVEFDAFDGRFVGAGNMQMVAVELQPLQFVLQVVWVHSEIEQGADKHVAAHAAEDVEI